MKRLFLLAAATMAVAPALALADTPDYVPSAPPESNYMPPTPSESSSASASSSSSTSNKSSIHSEFRGGPGFVTFTGQAAASFDPGISYGVGWQLDAPPRLPLGLELSYQGAAYTLQGGNYFQQGTVLENGGQALVRLGPNYRRLEPYAFGGYGVTAVSTTSVVSASDAASTGTIMKAPVGAGVDVELTQGLHPVTLGARGAYNFVFNGNHAFNIPGGNGRSEDQIGAQLLLGGQF